MASPVLLPIFILVGLELFGLALLPAGMLSNTVGSLLSLVTTVLAGGVLCSRLHLSGLRVMMGGS
jgi:hypothetical protein